MPLTASDPQSLAQWIDVQTAARGDEWLAGLDVRKQEEARFHDADREGHRDEHVDSSPNRRFYEVATVVDDFVDRWLGTTVGHKVFLDYACGNGKQAIKAARLGAALAVGIDISEVSVQNATETAQRVGVASNTRFLQRDCESTEFPDASFDACLCSGMLHHLDLARAFPELARIMAPGGRILCVEALAYNPVIQWYRNRTPELRTDWEKDHILSLADVAFAKQWFDVSNIKYFLMATPLAMVLPRGPLQQVGRHVGNALDSVLTRLPYVQRWSWQFAFELVKPMSR